MFSVKDGFLQLGLCLVATMFVTVPSGVCPGLRVLRGFQSCALT